MLITGKSIDAIPKGTPFYFSEDGLQVGGEMPDGGILICESQREIPPATEFFVTLSFGGETAGVSLQPPTNMVRVNITRDDILNDDLLSMADVVGGRLGAAASESLHRQFAREFLQPW